MSIREWVSTTVDRLRRPPATAGEFDERHREVGEARLEPLIREYWDWAAVALYLLVTVDLLTTFYAAAAVGVRAEANPVMAWLLTQPFGVVLGVNLAVIVVAAACFRALMAMLRRTPRPYDRYFALCIEAWLGGLLAAGLLVFANNLAVAVHGVSLL